MKFKLVKIGFKTSFTKLETCEFQLCKFITEINFILRFFKIKFNITHVIEFLPK